MYVWCWLTAESSPNQFEVVELRVAVAAVAATVALPTTKLEAVGVEVEVVVTSI